jgi:2-polyprenyl-3-methyl-5-hydroxy-6-metoxy-1,4-benzoquinol methylase
MPVERQFDGRSRFHRWASRAKHVAAAPLPGKVYWNLMGRFKPVAAVTSNARDLADSQESGREVVELLDRLGALDESTVALQIGSGLGRIEEHLAGRVRRCCGADISPSMVRQAKRLVRHPNVEFVCTDGRTLDHWSDSSFTLIFSVYVFQHIPREQVGRYIRESLTKLEPGGHLIFQMMIDESQRHPEPTTDHPYALRHYTRAQVRELLEFAGFAEISTAGLDSPRDTGMPEGDIVFSARRPG